MFCAKAKELNDPVKIELGTEVIWAGLFYLCAFKFKNVN